MFFHFPAHNAYSRSDNPFRLSTGFRLHVCGSFFINDSQDLTEIIYRRSYNVTY